MWATKGVTSQQGSGQACGPLSPPAMHIVLSFLPEGHPGVSW